MELLIKTTKDILDEDLSLLKRGILISILLSKDPNPKITWARFKETCKVSQIKQELIELQEDGYLKWSGYKSAKKSFEVDVWKNQRIEVIDFMNNLYRRNFRNDSSAVKTNLTQRLIENGIEDVKLVIANRYSEWKDDSFMSKYLTPETIFKKSKFDKYLEEAQRTRVGESFTTADNIDLKNGDEITLEVVEKFSDDDTYNLKIYRTSPSGELLGTGNKATRYGKDIKKTLKLAKLQSYIEHRYFYVVN